MSNCVCVVASRTVLWLLFTFTALGCLILAFLSPTWLTAPSVDRVTIDPTSSPSSSPLPVVQSGKGLEVGLVKHCFVQNRRNRDGGVACLFLTFDQLDSASWKASTILAGVGTALLVVATAMGVVSFWKRNAGRYNIVSVAGLLQGITMFILVPAVGVYPLAWSSDTFKRTCGDEAGIYKRGDCSITWGLYVAAGGVLMTLIACLLSPKAAKACNSHRVEEKVGHGYSCIFVR
eukprot:m.7669 g.7669  ORF g.7669 m.7669 type:complete len:233 (+) comp19347_c0_seq2:152-850(+)